MLNIVRRKVQLKCQAENIKIKSNESGVTDGVNDFKSSKTLVDFFKKRLKFFGPYQDFVQEGENFMFHSILSSSINIGLLNPSEIVDELAKYKSKVNINSFEGYLRQLFWREYQRYCYMYYPWEGKNYFGHRVSNQSSPGAF